MINFKTFLTEVFNQPYPHTGKGPYRFSSPNDDYTVHINHEDNKHADVIFSSRSGGVFHSNAEKSQAGKVFSSVHNVIKDHLTKNPQLSSIGFSGSKGMSDDGSRIKLYRHMVRHFTGVNNKKGEPDKHEEDDRGASTYFKIHKKDFK